MYFKADCWRRNKSGELQIKVIRLSFFKRYDKSHQDLFNFSRYILFQIVWVCLNHVNIQYQIYIVVGHLYNYVYFFKCITIFKLLLKIHNLIQKQKLFTFTCTSKKILNAIIQTVVQWSWSGKYNVTPSRKRISEKYHTTITWINWPSVVVYWFHFSWNNLEHAN